MKPDNKRDEHQKPGAQPKRDNTVAGSGDNRGAGDLDGNRSADGAKAPGTDAPETK